MISYSEWRREMLTMTRPGTAMLFALTIVEVMLGKEKRDEIAGPMIVAETL
jgi:protein DJ-1